MTRCEDHIKTEKQALANNCWPEPLANGIPRFIIGDRGLTLPEEAAIVSYLKTLFDIPTVKKPKRFSLRKFYKGKLK